MAKQKITFTIKNKNEAGPLELTIEKVEIPTKKGNKKVEKIFFCASPSEREDIKNTLESKKTDGTENKVFELEYNDEDLEIEEGGPNLMSESKASGSEPHGPKPKSTHILDDKGELRIWELNLITVAVKGETTPQDNSKKPDSSKPETPKTPDQKPNSDNPNKGPSSPSPKQPDKSPEEDTSKPQDAPPKNPEPTPEQVNDAKNKLKQARENSNNKEEELVNSLDETRDTVERSSDQDLKKEKELTESELGKIDKKKLREIIRDEVAKELQKFGIKAGDLSPEAKQKLDELNNNNNNNNNNNIEPAEAQGIRTQVLNEASMQALDTLITQLEQAIKQGEEKKIESKAKALQRFIGDNSDEYIQNAYRVKKDIVQNLLEKAKNQSSQNKDREGFFRPNNPLMWVSGAAVIGLVAGIILIIRSHRQKREV